MLLDTFAAFSKAQDWEQGRRPIVWASNAYLMEQTGFSRSSLKRHAARLIAAGVIAAKDSPNGKRWGHRGRDGHIQEAYGFDLGPLAARTAEFEKLFTDRQIERQRCNQLKREITALRRSIRARLDAMQDASNSMVEATFQSLLGLLPLRSTPASQLQEILETLHKFEASITPEHPHIEPALNADVIEDNSAYTGQDLNPMGPSSEPHIQTTNQHQSKDCKDENKIRLKKRETDPILDTVDLRIIMHACPEFRQMTRDLGNYIANWTELHRMAGMVRSMIGVSNQIWANAREKLGVTRAAAAMALVFDKFSAGEITSAGAYLHAMTQRDAQGDLHLARSFYGRLSRTAG